MEKIYSTLFLCLFCFSIYAQEANERLLKKLVEKNILTKSEADDLLQESEPIATKSGIDQSLDKTRKIFNNTPYLEIGGYGLLLYGYDNTKSTKHNLKSRVIFLHAKGQLTKTLGYFVMFELMDARMYEYYLDWTPLKEMNFRVGQFKVPISIENLMSLTTLETIHYSRSVSALTGMGDDVLKAQNGINNTGRDMGIQMSGDLLKTENRHLIHYALGVFQGTGLNTSEKDNVKDFVASILLEPVKGWKIGGSTLLGAATYKFEDTPEKRHVRNRWIASTEFQSGRFYARAEWLKGKDSSINREGLYGIVKYFVVPKKLSLAGKTDYYNSNKKKNIEVIDYLAGVDYWFYNRCRVQVNYQYSDYSKKWNQKNSHLVMGQLQIVF